MCLWPKVKRLRAVKGETDEIGSIPNSDLNEGQLQAFNRATAGESLFITGGAGSGKSFVLRRIISYLNVGLRRVIVAASTGLAASQYKDGRTIHSLVGKDSPLTSLKGESLTIVVDQVSMVAASLLDQLAEMVASQVKSSKTETRKRWPSDVQLICVGDFLQLPPINAKFAFQSSTWGALELRKHTIILSQSRRQVDVRFVSLLNRLRVGICTSDDVETLNTRRLNNHDKSMTHLYTRNRDVKTENERRTNHGSFGEVKS